MPNVMGEMIPVVAIVGGLSIAAYSMFLKMKARKLMHEERLAMIEKGLTPPPLRESDLADFPRRRHHLRHMGVLLVAIGVGVGFLIALNDELNHALGVGGVITLIGVAFLINAAIDRRAAPGPETMRQEDQHP